MVSNRLPVTVMEVCNFLQLKEITGGSATTLSSYLDTEYNLYP